MLAGTLPFEASTAPALMEKHFRADVPALSTMKGVVLPSAVDDVLRRGLAKDPAARFPTAAALIEALVAAIGDRSARPLRPTRRAPARRIGALPMIAGGVALAVTGLGIYVVTRDRGDDRSSASPVAAPAEGGPMVDVLSTPPGAKVMVGADMLGVTPRKVPLGTHGTVVVEIRKPGYVAVTRTLTAADRSINVNLQPVVGFEGVWAMKSGELRRFRRDGENVVAFKLAAAGDEGSFYRRFELVDVAGTAVAFKAVEDHVDERAPDEPSCHVPLEARYEYDPGGDELDLHKERVALELVDGKCVNAGKEWGPPQSLTRIRGASETSAWVESRAGGGLPANANNANADAVVDNPAFDPKEEEARKAELGKKEKGGKKAPPKKKVGAENVDRPSDQLDAKTRGAVQANKLAPPPDEKKEDVQQKAPPQAPNPPPDRTQQAAPPPQAQQPPQLKAKPTQATKPQAQQGRIEPEGALDIPDADQQGR
jgi:hypothetical protein